MGWRQQKDNEGHNTVDGRNPVNSPVEVVSLSHYLYARFYTSQVVVNGIIQGICKANIQWYTWWVVSNIFYFHPYLGKISNLTNIFNKL